MFLNGNIRNYGLRICPFLKMTSSLPSKQKQILKMIANIDPAKSAIASIVSAVAGTWYNYCTAYFSAITLAGANTAFQHAAWTVAILAGIVSIINGVRQWKRKTKTKQ